MAKRDIVFERASVFLWNVNISNGDLNHVLKVSDRVFCEASEIIGVKERKKWQLRLNSDRIPKYFATLVYVGGGRPKGIIPQLQSLHGLQNNTNLIQWLQKRSLDIELFHKIISGEAELKKCNLFNPTTSSFMDTNSTWVGSHQERPPPVPVGAERKQKILANNDKEEFDNPIMSQAKELIVRVMSCSKPTDPKVGTVISKESDVDLAIFMCKTLERAVQVYHASKEQLRNQLPSNSCHENDQTNIALGKEDMTPRNACLFGLSEPLLPYSSIDNQERLKRTARRSSAQDMFPTGPPYKRKPFQ